MGAMASQITILTNVNSTIYSGTDQRKHQISASLAFCAGNYRGTGEFPAQLASNAENVSIWWLHGSDRNKTLHMEPVPGIATYFPAVVCAGIYYEKFIAIWMRVKGNFYRINDEKSLAKWASV